MEYIIVTFHEDRAVLIDDQENGRTNQSLRISPGTHTFCLGGEKDFSPPEVTCVVADTSVLDPKVIAFGGNDA